ncbi:unnamed protein product [Knipowitschia caucasica]|uniref:Uncharacterized protein n=1 Tax=Knipowitschia caucasica TaxID=637954 RepID=A0AAV2J6J4_KNICA
MTATIPATRSGDKLDPKGKATELMVRLRRVLWLVLSMLSLSLLLVALGIYTNTLTETVTVSGFSSGIIINSSMVFFSFGIITSAFCLMIDGAIAFNMDMRPLKAGRCQFYSSGSGFLYEHYYTTVSCWTIEESCNITVRSGTCYCCDLYNCANGAYLNHYYEFVGVQSCHDVFILHFLIWSLTGLNLVVFFMGILTTAVLGSIKGKRGPGPGSESCGSGLSSPTAPLLMDASVHSASQLHPHASVYIPSSSPPPSSSSSTSVPHVSSLSQRFPLGSSLGGPLPFAPLSFSA